jgi:hypothetical protein
MDHWHVLTALQNPKIDHDDIYMTLPEGWPQGSNGSKIVVRCRKALYGLKYAPGLWHNDINSFLLPLGFTQPSSDANHYLHSHSILIHLYIDDISM